MRNNYRSKIFIIRDSFFWGDVVNMVSHGVLEHYIGCCNNSAARDV